MQTVLLTGASGYAGGAIRGGLRARGWKVLTAGRRPTDDVRFDLLHPESLAALPAGIDACVHAAAANEILCRQDPLAAYTANVTATRALAGRLREAGVKHVVYLSTFHVFGKPAGRLDEAAVPVPANDYGLTHLLAEQLLAAQDFRTTILRPANLFGTPADWSTFDRWTLAPFDFTRQAVGEGALRLLSDGSPVRCYVSLDRLVVAVVQGLDLALPGLTHVSGQPWRMDALATLCAGVVAAAGGGEVPVSLGTNRPQEAAYTFGSAHWNDEADTDGTRMTVFVRDVATRLLKERSR
ncbi:NAD(P)-dependent oxidoreductase [Cupriavidus pauculus]|uniref:NAD-dependent epimerase/dehydratase family protein n=1 Tax=Cupriavidus pauculus TaxID=82633 RepID=UPI001EE26F18|nr:SDR family oxidoreductase [Cupriavidus pauculus]GJG94154.1 SDR family oxidoreductase [Cupriavidus pauculus]